MGLEELLKLDDKTILTGVATDGTRYLGLMLEFYSKKFGQSCFSCPSRFPEYLRMLRNSTMELVTNKKAETFQLKPGVFIPVFGTSDGYSDKNITDEAALKVLSKNSNAIKLFDKFPADWETQVAAYGLGETKVNSISELSNLNFKAIKALFPDAKGTSKADLLKSIAEKYPELDKKTGAEELPADGAPAEGSAEDLL